MRSIKTYEGFLDFFVTTKNDRFLYDLSQSISYMVYDSNLEESHGMNFELKVDNNIIECEYLGLNHFSSTDKLFVNNVEYNLNNVKEKYLLSVLKEIKSLSYKNKSIVEMFCTLFLLPKNKDNLSEIKFRLEEFDVFKDQYGEIDLLRVENLFNYYNVDMYTQNKKYNLLPIIVIKDVLKELKESRLDSIYIYSKR